MIISTDAAKSDSFSQEKHSQGIEEDFLNLIKNIF